MSRAPGGADNSYLFDAEARIKTGDEKEGEGSVQSMASTAFVTFFANRDKWFGWSAVGCGEDAAL